MVHVLQGWCRRPYVGERLCDRYMQLDGNTRRSGCTTYGTATALKVIGIWLHLTRSVVFLRISLARKPTCHCRTCPRRGLKSCASPSCLCCRALHGFADVTRIFKHYFACCA